MRHIPLLEPGTLVKVSVKQRLNRFVVSVIRGGRLYRAHINNTGRLEQFLIPGRTGFCLVPDKPGATDFRLIALAEPGAAALIDTQLQMRAFEAGFEQGLYPWLQGLTRYRRDAALGRSRIDYRMEGTQGIMYLEAKSAVLRRGTAALYPDCPTLRGQKHVRELQAWAAGGNKAAILFIAALPGIQTFRPNREADPALYRQLLRAAASGVDLVAIGMALDPSEACIYLYAPSLPVEWE